MYTFICGNVKYSFRKKKIKELIKLEKLSIDLNLTVIPQAQW